MNNDLWADILDCQAMLEKALAISKERGNAWAVAEAAYYSVKAETAYRLMKEGNSASFIALVIKGDPEVNEAMAECNARLVEYENAKEARNVFKKKLDTLREEYAREWNQSKER